jgi:hypothetical protein
MEAGGMKRDLEMERMRAVLREAGNQFQLYADYHLAKQPPDREKAAVNIHWAMRCHEAAMNSQPWS